MNIGINGFQWHPRCGGIGNYLRTLIRRWPDFFPEDRLTLFSQPDQVAALSAWIQLPGERIRACPQDQIREHLAGIELYFSPFGMIWPRPLPVPTVITIADLQERYHPEFFTPEDIAHRKLHYDESLRAADHVIAISDFTRDSVLRFIGLPPQKVSRIHLCADELPEPQKPAKPPASERFFFYPANFWPHKNHSRLLEALALLRDQGRPVACCFTGDTFGREADWRRDINTHGLDAWVRHLGVVSGPELSWLYHSAAALILPSLFEGFGLPVLEAWSAGCPVLCSRATSLPEVAGDAALYFEPTDPVSIAATITAFLASNDPSRNLTQAGRARLTRFSPENLVRQHRHLFASLNGYQRL